MPVSYTETRNMVLPKRQVGDGSCQHENLTNGDKSISRTIEAIMRHMASPSRHATDPTNGTEKFEKEILVKKRRYIWSEARFVRTMLPFVVTSAWPAMARKSTAKASWS